MSSMGANYTGKGETWRVDGGETVGVSSAAPGKSGTRIFPVKSSLSATYEEVRRQD
ncbi:BnaCnng13710D [Brassica napus]|uniref:BnaCnng13710D protein n=1 Tax=Brassica napus TaxID=3708 RepID=A0A078I5U3_BRANA|nr:BnaCnng13710D [Brassica napus]